MFADDADDWADDAENLDQDVFELTEALREVLNPAFENVEAGAVEHMLDAILEGLPAAEGFNFTNVLSQIGRGAQQALRDPTVRQIAGTALPMAGAAAGTIFGGPAGTAVGGQLGGLAAKAISGVGVRRPGAEPAPIPTPLPGVAAPGATPKHGSSAAAQLLQLTQNPDVLKSLASLALGAMGRSSVPVGASGQQVPVGAFMNMLGSLAAQAAADADQLMSENDVTPSYLLDGEGRFRGDPLLPENRAHLLYQALATAEEERLLDTVEGAEDVWE
jgi:hypothetical protein